MTNYSALMSKKQVTGMNEKQVPAMDEHESLKPESSYYNTPGILRFFGGNWRAGSKRGY